MNQYPKLFTDVKTGPVTLFGDEGWIIQGEAPSGDNIAKFRKAVGVLYRCTQLRSNAIRRLPWRILNDREDVLWESTQQRPPPSLLWAKNIKHLLGLTEAALILKSESFWHIERNRVKATGVRWMAPVTMTPVWDKDKGLVKFERKLNDNGIEVKLVFPIEDVVYTWFVDPLHETKPDQPPAGAAMAAAGVLYNVNLFTSGFFERGAIKATLLTVKGNVAVPERERLKAWWKRFFGGVQNAGNAEVLNADVVPVIIGEGISELSNTELTGENREEIATTLGIPHSMVFSNASNFATASQDKLNFYDETIIPEGEIIQDSLNTQLFEPLGLQFEFVPDTLDIYQEDEQERSQSFAHYVGAGMKPSIAAEILGVDLPHGIEYADLDEKDEPDPVIAPAQPFGQPPPAQPVAPDAEQVAEKRAADIDKWRRKAAKRMESGKSALCEFESEWLSPLEIAYVRGRLASATTKAAIDAAFRPEEGGADQDFFTLPKCWSGKNIPDAAVSIAAWKAMILQLDPDDPEKEQDIRMGLERKTERDLAGALRKEQEIVVRRVQQYDEAVDFFREDLENTLSAIRDERDMYDMIQRALLQGVDLGVATSVSQFDKIGFGFDYTLAHSGARTWVDGYTFELVTGIDNTTERLLRQALTTWISNGLPLGDLIDQLAPIFGRQRAELISSTEITRAYARGTLAGYAAAGYGEGQPTVDIPLHPRCRCWWALRMNDDGSADYIFLTSNDERTCPLCGPLHRQAVGVARSAR